MSRITRPLAASAVLVVCVAAAAGAADPPATPHPIMRPDRLTLERWVADYQAVPRFAAARGAEATRAGSLSLLSHLDYTPADRSQGYCGDCWAWAGTGVLDIALDFAGAHDRLSVQYLNSCLTATNWACCGGWLSDFVDFYTSDVNAAIPWSNSNASWQDGARQCSDGSSLTACGSISTSPDYPITSIAEVAISTQSQSQAAAIANIKSVLNQNKAVWLAFYLPDSADWSAFYDFWGSHGESAIWNPDFSCGHTWNNNQGGGHAVLVVGYDDTDPDPANHYWLVVNSWGASSARPNGLFRMAMDIDYSCSLDMGGWTMYSLFWQTLNVTFDLPEPTVIFLNGFENGDVAGWSKVTS